jgi:DNA-binding NarL/FixJ family response regulator
MRNLEGGSDCRAGERIPKSRSLTPRELEVLQQLAGGASNSAISHSLRIGSGTTKKHVAAIFRKLEVSNRTQAVTQAIAIGLIEVQ